MKNIITGVVAGIIVFAWVMISWMVLPLHKSSFHSFENAEVVAHVVTTNTPQSGVYVYPPFDASKEDMASKPHIFTSVTLEAKNFGLCMTIGLIIQILGGLFLTCLVSIANVSTFGDKMKIILKAAIFASIVGVLPNWNWWGSSVGFTLLAVADLLIGWSLAGIFIAKRV